jgi:hypothetical protein
MKKLKKIKNGLTARWHGDRGLSPWRTAAGSWRRAARPCHQRCSPAGYPTAPGLNVVGMALGMLLSCDMAAGTFRRGV